MVVSIFVSMVQSNEYEGIWDEATDNEGIWEALNCDGPIIDAQECIDVEFILLNLISGPVFLSKVPHFEFTIV